MRGARRRHDLGHGTGPEIPERLRRCVVEVRVEPTEVSKWVDKTINGVPTGVEELAWSLLFLARRRHHDAVAGIPKPEWSRR